MFYVELNDPSVTVRPQITNHRVWDQEMTVSTISSSTSHHIDHPNPSTNKDQLQAAINRLVSRANALKRRVNRSAIASNNNNNSNINNIIQQIDALTQNISNVDSDLDDVLSLPPNSNFQLQ
ncbi:hypothetical protein BDC45DRAFT_531563 [Circinella umbellata]|nr:hypothetical protein BDC45DRAFT_531563 [Circinella umbellata]